MLDILFDESHVQPTKLADHECPLLADSVTTRMRQEADTPEREPSRTGRRSVRSTNWCCRPKAVLGRRLPQLGEQQVDINPLTRRRST